MTTYTEDQMIAIGGRRWQKPGSDEIRVYLNDWEALVGIEIGAYKTGNISSCTWTREVGGETVTERISNNRARRFFPVKVYWTSTDGKVWSPLRSIGDDIRVTGGGQALINALHAGIRRVLAATSVSAQ